MQEVSLIATLAWGLGLALIFGFGATKLKMPALVGYLIAGVAIAPATPGFVGDVQFAQQLSEVGIVLLMFGVGLHFSLDDLMRVKGVAVPGAVLQMATATGLGTLLSWLWGWSLPSAFMLGLCLSCASTVVITKALQTNGLLQSDEGQLAVGWVVVEDVVTVFMLVLLPVLADTIHSGAQMGWPVVMDIAQTMVLICGFVAVMMIGGRRVLPLLLLRAVQTGSRELFTLCVIVIAIGIAYASASIFNVSFALGAFFAGMVMRESEYAHRAAQDTLPLQDAFSVIFFFAVGMLFDPSILIEEPFKVLCLVLLIIVGKGVGAAFWTRLFGRSRRCAASMGISIAQIGEFSFILASLGLSLKLLPAEGISLVLAASIITIACNSLMYAFRTPILNRWFPQPVLPDPVVVAPTKKREKGPILIIGAGVMGRELYESFADKQIACQVIERDQRRISQQELERDFILGDAVHTDTLLKAKVTDAELVIITIEDVVAERKIIDEIRRMSPQVQIMAMANEETDIEFFKDAHGNIVENVRCFDLKKEVSKNILYYGVGYYRRKTN